MWLQWFILMSICVLFCSILVAHAQDAHNSNEKPLIQCYKCGEPCKGEVLRVQSKHFHLKCFTCKGKYSTKPWRSFVDGCMTYAPHEVKGFKATVQLIYSMSYKYVLWYDNVIKVVFLPKMFTKYIEKELFCGS